jgi:hypothetical protein
MKEQEEKEKVKILLDKAMAETPVEERDEGYEMLGEFSEATPDIDVTQETEGEIAPEVEEVAAEVEAKPQQRGLMARG